MTTVIFIACIIIGLVYALRHGRKAKDDILKYNRDKASKKSDSDSAI